jgi:hypothetical protein
MGRQSSYDLTVFEPEVAPKDYAEFLAWFARQMTCEEDHSYDNPAEASERLRGWLREMVKMFPSGAGSLFEDEPKDLDEDSYSGYSIGREMIYAIFVTVKAEVARQRMFELAAEYGLGLFEPSSEQAEIWRPQSGKLVLMGVKELEEAPKASGFLQRLVGKVRGSSLPRPRLPDWM